MIDNLLVDKTFGSKDILVGDRNAIIIAARSSAYGHLYETKVQCPACQTTNKVTFDLSNPYIFEGDLTEFDVEETETGSYIATTPRSQIKVELRLLTGHDEGKIVKLMNTNKKEEEIVSSQMKMYVKSVNGHSEAPYINYFVENVPAYEARWLRKCYETLAPNIKVSEDFECDNCGHQQEMEVPFNTDFFGLTNEYMENVYEIFFTLKHYGGWSLTEMYSLPVGLRKWCLKELSKNMRKKKKNTIKQNDNAWFSKHFLFKTSYNQEGFTCP